MAFVMNEDGNREELDTLTDKRVLDFLGLDNVRDVSYEDSTETPYRFLWNDELKNEEEVELNPYSTVLFGYDHPIRGPIIVFQLNELHRTFWS